LPAALETHFEIVEDSVDDTIGVESDGGIIPEGGVVDDSRPRPAVLDSSESEITTGETSLGIKDARRLFFRDFMDGPLEERRRVLALLLEVDIDKLKKDERRGLVNLWRGVDRRGKDQEIFHKIPKISFLQIFYLSHNI
jgi:hypothetical protein